MGGSKFFSRSCLQVLKGKVTEDLAHLVHTTPEVKGGYYLSGCEQQTSQLVFSAFANTELTSLNMKLLVSKCLRSQEKVEQRLNLYKAGDHSFWTCNKANSLETKATPLGEHTHTTPRRSGWGTEEVCVRESGSPS